MLKQRHFSGSSQERQRKNERKCQQGEVSQALYLTFRLLPGNQLCVKQYDGYMQKTKQANHPKNHSSHGKKLYCLRDGGGEAGQSARDLQH